tara:strand:- start:500 stop:970 length:471 start_codon:yes stop_codon:yes gene_type:complete
MRIGIGVDYHRLVPNRPLILGGVHITHELGLLGHSDADVLTHAIMDAMLGALGLGSIGDHFPDSDASYKDADSLDLLAKTQSLIQEQGYQISNIDTVIVAQAPKLSPHIPAMRQQLASTLGISETQIGIKATTSEGMGPEGRKEGMSSHAVVLLST